MQRKRTLTSFLSRLQSSPATIPAMIFLVMALSFGVFIPSVGFYWDDWPTIFVKHSGGSFFQYYGISRPLVPIHDTLFTSILGVNPLAWQISCFLFRVAVALAFWWCFSLIWPNARRQVFAAALLFALYPAFSQWPLAVTYQSGFIEYALYFVSIAWMILAIRHPKKFYLFTGLAILSAAIQLLISEYFWGLELLRPLILWLLFRDPAGSWKKRLKKVFLNWSPYLILLFAVVLNRFLVPQSANVDHSTTKVVTLLLSSPVKEIIHLVETFLRDSVYVLVNAWFPVVSLDSMDFSSSLSMLSWGMAALIAVLTGFALGKQPDGPSDRPQTAPGSWGRQALLVGGIALIAGLLPIWLGGKQVFSNIYSDRFSIPAFVGTSLLIVGILDLIASKWAYQAVILSVLLGLSAGNYFRQANQYRWEWTYEQRFAWQLYWRAPSIQPQTAILSEGGIFQWVTKYSLASVINTLYPAPGRSTDLPYWAFELDTLSSPETLLKGMPISDGVRSLSFSGVSTDSLLISYDPYMKHGGFVHCVWVLNPNDRYAHGIGPLTRASLPLSNVKRILLEPASGSSPDRVVFGPEPAHTWCYYFEKADLARQLGDWKAVASLGDEAAAHSYTPNDPYEWLPFIEGYIHTKNWEKAHTLSLETDRWNPELIPAVCDAWSRSLRSMELSASELADASGWQEEFHCKAH
jgi:hypothetical protein